MRVLLGGWVGGWRRMADGMGWDGTKERELVGFCGVRSDDAFVRSGNLRHTPARSGTPAHVYYWAYHGLLWIVEVIPRMQACPLVLGEIFQESE